MYCSPPGSSVHGISQARILEWVVIPFFRGSFQSRDQTQVSRIAGRFFIIWASKEAQILCISAYIWNLERWYWWTYIQGKNRDIDTENRLVDKEGEGEGGPNQESDIDMYTFGSVQSLSSVRLFSTPWIAARQDSLSITNSLSPPKLMSIESVMPSNHLILCHPLLLLPSVFPNIRVFSNESVLRIR